MSEVPEISADASEAGPQPTLALNISKQHRKQLDDDDAMELDRAIGKPNRKKKSIIHEN